MGVLVFVGSVALFAVLCLLFAPDGTDRRTERERRGSWAPLRT